MLYSPSREPRSHICFKGSKIRASYISFAQKEKKRLEAQLANWEVEIAARKKEVARLKGLHKSSWLR